MVNMGAMSQPASTALDGVALVARWLVNLAVGKVFSSNAARIRRDTETSWSIGKAASWDDRQFQVADVVSTVEGDHLAASRAFCEVHPAVPAGMISSERTRLRWVAEGLAREIAQASRYVTWARRTSPELHAAMEKAGLGAALVWIEPFTEQAAWGNNIGFAVFADSQEAADWVAQWIVRFGGHKGDGPMACAFPSRQKPVAAPFAAFARTDYQSIGD